MAGIVWRDVDDALGRLDAVLRPRVGRRMTATVLKNVRDLREAGGTPEAALRAVHQYLDAYARIPESGTPFPLGVAKAIGDVGPVKLALLNQRMRRREPFLALEMADTEARSVAQHADALLPSYGEEDAEFAVRVAWKCAHHFRLNLVAGRAYNRNDAAPTTLLWDAWQAQGGRGTPIAVVPDDVGEPGVIYALSDAPPTPNVLERFHASGFVFSPHRGDAISLDTPAAAQRFFARVPLAITKHTLGFLLHVIRLALPPVPIDVDGDLMITWGDQEDAEPSSAASLLLGVTGPPVPSRDVVHITAGSETFTYRPGELSLGSAL